MATANGLVVLLCLALMAAAATAAQFQVGGAKGWSVPDGTAEPYNTWSGRMRFKIGDQLLFVYPKDADSVLLVDQAAYNACNTTTYVTKFEGGSTVFTLDRSGPFFFISGNQAGCTANQKLIVVVLSADHTPPGPSPMPPSSMPPALSPSSSSSPPMPSPAPPPSMAPPAGAPMSPPSGAPMPTPESAPSPTGSAPGSAPAATPGSAPGTPGSPPSSAPGTPGGAPQPPADSTSPAGANSTSGAAPVKAGLIGAIAAGFGFAMLAI